MVSAALRHHTLAIVEDNITKARVEVTVPRSVLRDIDNRLAPCRLLTAFHRDILVEVLNEFSKRKQRVVVLKGPVLAERYYPKVHLRLFSDIDLMVPRSAVPEVQATLHDLGYEIEEPQKEELRLEKYGEIPFVRHRDPVPIKLELHWDFVNSRSLRLVAGVRARDFCDRAVPTSVLGAPAFELTPEDTVFGLVLHLAYNHQFHHLLSIVDICLVLRRCGDGFDWDKFLGLAQKKRLRLAFSTAFTFADELFGLRIPKKASEYFAPDRLSSKLAAPLLSKRFLANSNYFRKSMRRKLYREALKREGL
jgi:hypothetical protein